MMVIDMVLILILNNIAFAKNDNTNKLLNTDGIASGDITNNSAKSSTNAQALMHVQYDTNASFHIHNH